MASPGDGGMTAAGIAGPSDTGGRRGRGDGWERRRIPSLWKGWAGLLGQMCGYRRHGGGNPSQRKLGGAPARPQGGAEQRGIPQGLPRLAAGAGLAACPPPPPPSTLHPGSETANQQMSFALALGRWSGEAMGWDTAVSVS